MPKQRLQAMEMTTFSPVAVAAVRTAVMTTEREKELAMAMVIQTRLSRLHLHLHLRKTATPPRCSKSRFFP